MPIKSLSVPTQSKLQSLFIYNEDDGTLTWRERPESHFVNLGACKRWNAQHPGTIAGGAMAIGYSRVSIDGTRYLSHRLIWSLVYGEAIGPGLQIDHINGNRSDNRILNLRVVSISENRRNQKTCCTNTSGVTGVSWHKDARKWSAAPHLGGKSQYIGLFAEKADAAMAVANFYRENGFTERHIGQAQ